MTRRLALALTLTLSLVSSSALSDDLKSEAQARFEVGREHAKEGRWASALQSFQASYDAFPTRAAGKNIAVSLRELGRYDEALEAYADLLRRFGRDLSGSDRTEIDADVAQLQRFLGEILITSEPPGTAVLVDGRERGTTPLAAPLLVPVGTRTVRLLKEGYSPFETRVIVSSGDRATVTGRLLAVTELGVLRVTEQWGQDAEVRLDSAVVGRTPWEGKVSAGVHIVTLRGKGDVGAAPRSVRVAMGQKTAVSIAVGVLPGELRVEPTPPSARVLVDGRPVSVGTFSGMIRSGKHAVDVVASFYDPHHAIVVVASDAPQALRVSLLPVARLWLDLSAGADAFMPLNGSRQAADCAGGCFGSTYTVHAGYRLTRYLSLGALFANVGGSRAGGSIGMLSGAVAVSYQLLDRTPITLRLFAGLGLGAAWSPVAGPEVRFGYRFTRTLGVDAGLSATFTRYPQADGNMAPGVFFPATLALNTGL